MGTAGLDVKRLTGYLERLKVDCVLVEGDELSDHCVLQLSSIKRPGMTALLQYENKGFEPRLAVLKILPSSIKQVNSEGLQVTEKAIRLAGPRSGDVNIIVRLVSDFFLKQRR